MAMNRRILILANRCSIDVEGLLQQLGMTQYQVIVVNSVQEGHNWMAQHGLPHLMIVGFNASQPEHLTFSREIYASTGMPVILIADDSIPAGDALDALYCADDLVRCQFATPQELALRIRRVLSRMMNFSYATGPSTRLTDWLAVDFDRHTVNIHGELRKLTTMESALLAVLFAQRGKIVDSMTLVEQAWAIDPQVKNVNALRVHLHRLRKKIEDDPDNPVLIVTERGLGYRLVNENEVAPGPVRAIPN